MKELNNVMVLNQKQQRENKFRTQVNFFKPDKNKILDVSLTEKENRGVNNTFDGGKKKRKQKNKIILMSVDGEPVDFSEGKMPDLRKIKKSPANSVMDKNDFLS